MYNTINNKERIETEKTLVKIFLISVENLLNKKSIPTWDPYFKPCGIAKNIVQTKKSLDSSSAESMECEKKYLNITCTETIKVIKPMLAQTAR